MTIFFVLNGLHYLMDNTNPNGYGPHISRDAAERASEGHDPNGTS
jgi:hypothetical protein